MDLDSVKHIQIHSLSEEGGERSVSILHSWLIPTSLACTLVRSGQLRQRELVNENISEADETCAEAKAKVSLRS